MAASPGWAELLRAAVEADVVGFVVANAISANRYRHAELRDTINRLGYRPSPRPLVGEVLSRFMKGPSPAHDRTQLCFGQHLAVDIDDPTWQIGKNLTSAFVEAQNGRDMGEPRSQMREQRMYGRRPRAGNAADRFPSSPGAANVASGEPVTFFGQRCSRPGEADPSSAGSGRASVSPRESPAEAPEARNHRRAVVTTSSAAPSMCAETRSLGRSVKY